MMYVFRYPNFRGRGHFRGMTLLEMLLALALTAVLLAAISALIGAISVDQDVELGKQVEPSWQIMAIDRIRNDLLEASYWEANNGQVVIVGRDINHSRAQIEYTTWNDGNMTWLIRREKPEVMRSNDDTDAELVCAGVAAIELIPITPRDDGEVDSLRGNGNPPDDPAQSKELSNQYRLRFTMMDTKTPTLERVLTLR